MTAVVVAMVVATVATTPTATEARIVVRIEVAMIEDMIVAMKIADTTEATAAMTVGLKIVDTTVMLTVVMIAVIATMVMVENAMADETTAIVTAHEVVRLVAMSVTVTSANLIVTVGARESPSQPRDLDMPKVARAPNTETSMVKLVGTVESLAFAPANWCK